MDASHQKGSPAAESEDLSQESTPRVSEHVQQPSVGVSFRHLSCHGLATSTQYQTTFASYILTLPRLFLSLLRNRKPEKLQILQDFDGLINPGEMLLVLGRPGSGCSTFLKTIAGDTHGFCVSDDAEINYQGISHFVVRCIYGG
jgi:ATP-binding cassette, subfamily G (WHITE), member 2, PDR